MREERGVESALRGLAEGKGTCPSLKERSCAVYMVPPGYYLFFVGFCACDGKSGSRDPFFHSDKCKLES